MKETISIKNWDKLKILILIFTFQPQDSAHEYLHKMLKHKFHLPVFRTI